MPLSNDERGWVMTGLSGVACVFGASFICVDLIVRQFPKGRNFRIQDSDAFLSTSLSLSFGVMLFSALYSMLPSSKRSLQQGGYSARESAWIMIACFVGGVVGIQVLSNALHHFVPHDVIDCEHTHEDDVENPKEIDNDHDHENDHGSEHSHGRPQMRETIGPRRHTLAGQASTHTSGSKGSLQRSNALEGDDSSTPDSSRTYMTAQQSLQTAPSIRKQPELIEPTIKKQPSLRQLVSAGFSTLTSNKDPRCNGEDICYGYSEVCGPDCFRNINTRGRLTSAPSRPVVSRTATATESTPLLHSVAQDELQRPRTRAAAEGIADTKHVDASHLTVDNHESSDGGSATLGEEAHQSHEDHTNDNSDHHHHHVPKNAFLSIGLQTSIAIALHKLPEGFITYATNHANPKLGVAVFLALFIHNITEGFAMALPLYLAINNRIKAMLISFVLGGLSQPIGAGVAALWFKVAGEGNWAPSEAVYGGMFAVTAGIMASVALQLFSESLELTHSRVLCMVGAFAGMTILGVSSALTA